MLISNYFKTGLRFLWKTRGYSSLNILGLALGIAVCWLAYIFANDEYSFDAYHEHSDHIFRPTSTMALEDRTFEFAGSSYIMGEEFPKQIPEIKKSSRFKSGGALLQVGTEFFNQGFHYVDPQFFEIFDMAFVQGQPGDFNRPDVAVISGTIAETLGIREDIVGKEVVLILGGDEVRFEINGIYEDFPINSSLRPEIMIPFSVWANSPAGESRVNTWFDINMNAFFLLDENADPDQVSEKMTDILLTHDDFENTEVTLGLQALTDIHLNRRFDNSNGVEARGDNQLILIVSLIGALCLIIACVNYSNFAVGNYLVRLREVAVRKVFGAQKRSIFQQFVTEAFISACLGLIFSVGIISILLPGFSAYANKQYTLGVVFGPEMLLGGLIILTVVTLLAGMYPALVLSSYSTLNGLKGKPGVRGKNWFTKALIILQFAISVFLIAGVLSVNKQLNYLLRFDLGYQTQNLVRLFRPLTDENALQRYKRDLESIAGVEQVSIASGFNGTRIPLGDGATMDVGHARIDPDFISLMNIELLTGRDFDPELSTDLDAAIIVNEALVKKLGLENPIGARINFNYRQLEDPAIIGVVRDFYYESLHQEVQPLVLYISRQLTPYDHYVMIDPRQDRVLENLERVYQSHFSPYPFNYTFVEDDIRAQYELESNIRKISRVGALAAVFLSCLGLMGFMGTQVKQRMKEISIRKVIGAAPVQLFGLLSKSYFVWILSGFVIGLSAAVYLVGQWLTAYANRIRFSWDIGIMAIAVIAGVALLAILPQLYRAVFLNPVIHLKEE